MAHEAPSTSLTWWERVKTFEPALLRSVVTAVVLTLGVWGLDLSQWGDRLVESWTYLFPLIALLQGWWTRGSVTPSSTVISKVERDGTIV